MVLYACKGRHRTRGEAARRRAAAAPAVQPNSSLSALQPSAGKWSPQAAPRAGWALLVPLLPTAYEGQGCVCACPPMYWHSLHPIFSLPPRAVGMAAEGGDLRAHEAPNALQCFSAVPYCLCFAGYNRRVTAAFKCKSIGLFFKVVAAGMFFSSRLFLALK